MWWSIPDPRAALGRINLLLRSDAGISGHRRGVLSLHIILETLDDMAVKKDYVFEVMAVNGAWKLRRHCLSSR